VNTIVAGYRNSTNSLYILSVIGPILTIHTFSLLPHIASLYRLAIVSLYSYLYTKYIQIIYNILYKGSLCFGIPGVLEGALVKMKEILTVSLPRNCYNVRERG
jgi:hypothetical protein